MCNSVNQSCFSPAFKLQCHVSSAANVSVDEVYDLLGHYGQATCLWCSHKCNHQELFRKHVRIHHEGVQPIICTNCWHVCADYDSFVTHCSHKESKGKNSKQKEKTRKTAKKSKSAPVGIPFECEFNSSTTDIGVLHPKGLRKRSYSTARYECEHCHKVFSFSQGLRRHKWKCEEAIVSGPGITTRYIYGCPVCGKRYTTKYNMERHHMKCGSRGPQSCQICGKTFITQDSMKQHMIIVHSL
nr:hypothetical protein BgiMline_001761 [Biomphalaria glabrata]